MKEKIFTGPVSPVPRNPHLTTWHTGLWRDVCAISGFDLWWDRGGEEIAQFVLALLPRRDLMDMFMFLPLN